MAYVYRHIRLDKNIPFYIGIGSDDSNKYNRAYNGGLRSRNKYWNNIVSKSEYEVEIMLDNLSWEDACAKEKEFISLYGRRRDGGILANLTLGGEGQLGMTGELNGMYGKKTTDSAKEKQRAKKIGKAAHNKGKPMPKDQLAKLILINKGRPSWNKGKKMSQEMVEKCRNRPQNLKSGSLHPMFGKTHTPEAVKKIIAANIGRIPYNKGMKMSKEWCEKNKANKPTKNVFQFDIFGILIMEYTSLAKAAESNGILKSYLSYLCLGNKIYMGYRWSYKKASEEALSSFKLPLCSM